MKDTPAETLGQEILRLRTLAGVTLRAFAELIGVSAAYVSDIEHDRRRPSEEVLRRIAKKLKHVGATFEGLDQLNTRLDRDIQKWVATTPAVRQMLRQVKQSGRDPKEILRQLQDDAKGTKRGKNE
jgi:transcriptional regulator with XRE-family HTH domain